MMMMMMMVMVVMVKMMVNICDDDCDLSSDESYISQRSDVL